MVYKTVIAVKVNKSPKLYYIKKEGRSATGCFFRDGTSSTSMSEEEIERRLIASLQEDKLSLADIQSFLIDKRLWFRTVLPDLNYKKESLKDNVHQNVSQNDLEKIIKSI